MAQVAAVETPGVRAPRVRRSFDLDDEGGEGGEGGDTDVARINLCPRVRILVFREMARRASVAC